MPDPKNKRICDIDWSQVEYLSHGAYGRVYRVAPGVVVKVGELSHEEVERQRHFARLRLAVPVYDFRDDVILPPNIAEHCCRRHRYRSDSYTCTCHTPHGALLMAEATPAQSCRPYRRIQRFIDRFDAIAEKFNGFNWDAHQGNVGLYRGRYVAFDFFHWSDDRRVGHSV